MSRQLVHAPELDDLPLRSVVLDNDGDAWQKRIWWRSETYWALVGDDTHNLPETIKHCGPWTLIYHPDH